MGWTSANSPLSLSLQNCYDCRNMKPFFTLILISLAVAVGAGMWGREKNRLMIEKRLLAQVDASGIIKGASDGIEVRFDHFTGVVTGKVNSEEERRGLLSRLRESVGGGRIVDQLEVPAHPSAPLPLPPTVAQIPAQPAPPAVAVAVAIPPLTARLGLERGEGLTMILSGLVPSEKAKSDLSSAAQRVVPELITVENRISVDPSLKSPAWLDAVPELVANLIAGVQNPELRINEAVAQIGGATDDKEILKSLRSQFGAVFADYGKREDGLVFDEAKPAPGTRLPLVFYMGPWEGKVLLEGSIPALTQVKEIQNAAAATNGAEKVVSRLRVSPQTVDESWLYLVPSVVSALLDGNAGKAELIIVDHTFTLIGEMPDKAKKEALLELLEPVREAGYGVIDELKIKS